MCVYAKSSLQKKCDDIFVEKKKQVKQSSENWRPKLPGIIK